MTDRAFLKSFAALIAALVALMVILFILAQIVGGKPPKSVEATADAKAIADRIKPVGEVTVRATEAVKVAVTSANPVMDAIISSANAAGTDDKGKKIYESTCMVCHAAGVAGAPKLGDKVAWAPRIKTGMDALYANVIKGKGAMPPKGTYAGPDADLKSATDYIVAQSK